MKVAVIPARGGSKRIPRKNIRDFCGKPMIAWSIETAIASGCFDKIIVSTDDLEIADIAKKHGAEIPFMRPKELADDHTGTIPVIAHAIKEMQKSVKTISSVCCIYATAPFLQIPDLQLAEKILTENKCDYAFTVTRYSFPIQRAIKIKPDGCVTMFQPENFSTRSQDLEPSYHDAGQFYFGNIDAWLKEKPVFIANSFPVILPNDRVQDIDTEEDWKRAEIIFRLLKFNHNVS